jgi:tetratricopeptide (TPR) repeat protein
MARFCTGTIISGRVLSEIAIFPQLRARMHEDWRFSLPLSASQPLRSTFVLLSLVVAAASAIAQNSPSESEQVAYETAIHRKQVQTRTKGLELFLKNFPNSTLKERALESLADAYYQSGDIQKEQVTFERLFKVNPDNLRGLELKAQLMQFMLFGCDSGDCEQEQMSLADHGFRVLRSVSRPKYLSDAEFGHQKAAAAFAFHHLAGVAALMQHDYRIAQEHLSFVVEAYPNNLSYVYPLAIAYLNSSPPDMLRGLFFMARAAALSTAPHRKKIDQYGGQQYEKYHGSAEGWTDVVRLAKANQQMPSGFTITPAR